MNTERTELKKLAREALDKGTYSEFIKSIKEASKEEKPKKVSKK